VSRGAALARLAGLWVVVVLFAGGSEAVRRTRSGEWPRYWRKVKLTDIRPESGFAYVASLSRSDLSSHSRPSPARLMENGVVWSEGNDLHTEIRGIGHGRFSFWHDRVLFAASDNSDPRTNGRVYKIYYPLIGARLAGAVYGLATLVLIAAVLATVGAIRSGVLDPYPSLPLRLLRAHGVSLLASSGVVSLVVVAVIRAGNPQSPVVDSAWWVTIGLNLVAAVALRLRYGRVIPHYVPLAFLLALAVGYYFLTTQAPHRAQGCHTTLELPAWDAFCVAPDSASYYWSFAAREGSGGTRFWSSTRNPLYSWFGRVVVLGTGFDPTSYAARTSVGAAITDASDPLFRVVRAQILLLLAASLLACASMMRLLASPVPAVAFLWLYDHLFFTAFELNVVLTEALVQAWLFLLVAAFLAFLRSPRTWLLLAAAVSCGLLYLTRQAAAYAAVMLGVMMLWVLWRCRRRWWRQCAWACSVMLALCAIPDIRMLIETGSLTEQQARLQFQYRIAHALQYARAEDADLMPSEATRRWLERVVSLRDLEHEKIDRTLTREYDRMVSYVAANLYHVAYVVTPPDDPDFSPEFFLGVANPILARHRAEYLGFGFRFWQLGLSQPGLARIQLPGLSPLLTYAILWLLILWLRDRYALAAATLVSAHWLHVAVASFFAAPIPRMVWASEVLVGLAGLVLLWRTAERLGEGNRARELAARLAKLL